MFFAQACHSPPADFLDSLRMMLVMWIAIFLFCCIFAGVATTSNSSIAVVSALLEASPPACPYFCIGCSSDFAKAMDHQVTTFSDITEGNLMQDFFAKNLFCAAIMTLPVDDLRINMTVLGEVLYRTRVPLLILSASGFHDIPVGLNEVPKIIVQKQDSPGMRFVISMHQMSVLK